MQRLYNDDGMTSQFFVTNMFRPLSTVTYNTLPQGTNERTGATQNPKQES
jgi:hypothetical protein